MVGVEKKRMSEAKNLHMGFNSPPSGPCTRPPARAARAADGAGGAKQQSGSASLLPDDVPGIVHLIYLEAISSLPAAVSSVPTRCSKPGRRTVTSAIMTRGTRQMSRMKEIAVQRLDGLASRTLRCSPLSFWGAAR